MIEKTKRNKELFELWKKGTKISVLADMFEITPPTVREIITRQLKPKKPKQCVYPNLYKWMVDNELTISTLLIEIQKQYQFPISLETLRNCLHGKSCTKTTIDQLLGITGMKYEELFYREDT